MLVKYFLHQSTFSQYTSMSAEVKGRVLIVEDDLLLSMVEERLVKNLGYSVVGKIENGSEAVNKVGELNPDIIIMDISLKGELDGVETMQKIREESDVPVIYLSGSADRYHYERAKKTGFTEFLKKPVTSGDLEEPLHSALHQNDAQSTDSQGRKLNKSA